MNPPNNLVVEMTDKDVQDNLISILDSMERIRKEGITNLGASDEQKMDYLRLTGELASCLKTFMEENKLEGHTNSVCSLVDSDLLLRNYDPSQDNFWNDRESRLKTALDDCSAVLLRDDFVSENQAYHIFQALKYLTIKSKENKDDVYETILPYNTLLNESSLISPDISSYLIRQLLDVSSNGAGVKAKNIDITNFIKTLEQAGAFYVDIPKEFYPSLKKDFPRAILIEENGQKHARVVFGNKEEKQGLNIFKILQEYAQFNLESEEDLVKKTSNFYGFGKKFLSEMKTKIGVRESVTKQINNLEKVLILDDSAADSRNSRTQNQWIEYWNNINDERRFASAPDLYQFFKQLRTKGDEAKTLVDSLREDFKESWIMTSTRLIYQPNNYNAKIIHNYGNKNPALIKEMDIKVPEYLGVLIADKTNDEDCLTYLKALFDTKDDIEEIISVLEYISDKSRKKIKLWTPPLENNTYYIRKQHPERAVWLCFYDDEFHVNGNSHVGINLGRSRGVSENQQS